MNAEAGKADLTGMLDSMGLDELRDLRKSVDRAISGFEGRKRQEAISAAEQVAKEHGFKLADLVGGRTAARAKSAGEGSTATQAAYVNPDNPEQVWSGRGRRPGWVRDALAAGRTLEDLAA